MRKLNVYTDGSHIKGTKNIGIGAYCNYENKIYTLSYSLDNKILSKYGIYENVDISNPTAEFIAFSEVLSSIKDVKNVELNFYIDYIGVKYWMEGKWKTKTDSIIKVKKFCDNILSSSNFYVNIFHVNSHSGIEGNDIADKLAKSMLNYSNFDELIHNL